MIIPFGILTDATSSGLRKYIFKNFSIIRIDAFPERDNINKRVFEDVKMSTTIILTNKRKETKFFDIGISYDRIIKKEDRLQLTVEDLIELNPELVQIPLTDKRKFDLLLKIYQNRASLKIKQVSPCITGEVDMTFAKNALTVDNSSKKLLKGVQIDRYVEKTENEDISQGIIEFLDINKTAYPFRSSII